MASDITSPTQVYRINFGESYVGQVCYDWALGAQTTTCLDIPRDSQFNVMLLSLKGNSDTVFGVLTTGAKYDVYIDITYEQNVGGVNITKHSTGTVQVAVT